MEIIMIFKIERILVESILDTNKGIVFDLDERGALEQVQTCVDWFMQMPKTERISKSSPSAHQIKHRIERQPSGYKGYISREAAIIAALILGFPYSPKNDEIGLDEEYYRKWQKVHIEMHESPWTFMYYWKK